MKKKTLKKKCQKFVTIMSIVGVVLTLCKVGEVTPWYKRLVHREFRKLCWDGLRFRFGGARK